MADEKIQKQKVKKKAGKDGFYEVSAPLTSVKISLYGNSPESFDGKVVKLDLTKSLRGKNFELCLKVKNQDGQLSANPTKIILSGSYVRKSMRKGSDYIEDSFEILARDYIARIKPFLITRRKVSRSVRNALRLASRKYLEAHIKIRSAKEVFSDIMAGKIQKTMSQKLKKIYPLALCEIRAFELVRERTAEEVSKDKIEKVEDEE